MNIIAVIPARGGSKGVSDKNIKLLAGKPLLAYSIAAAKKSKLIKRIIVSTDSKKYASLAKEYRAEVPFLRPAELAGDSSTDYDFIKHLLDWFEENESSVPDYLIHLRPTTPMRDPKMIDHAIDALINNIEATSLRSAHEMPETAYKQIELDNGWYKTICSGSFELDNANQSRHSYPKTYSPNGYVDVLKTSFILENHMLHGNRVMGFITNLTTEVDTMDDFEFLEWQIIKNDEIIKKLFRV
ncbi:MAG: acylneuraminate cytidylyltransferase family protein [Bacteroidia bacterium]|nr:acylneuraminate cytidylyltransferase family protein [Bacteroidia bacterium]